MPRAVTAAAAGHRHIQQSRISMQDTTKGLLSWLHRLLLFDCQHEGGWGGGNCASWRQFNEMPNIIPGCPVSMNTTSRTLLSGLLRIPKQSTTSCITHVQCLAACRKEAQVGVSRTTQGRACCTLRGLWRCKASLSTSSMRTAGSVERSVTCHC